MLRESEGEQLIEIFPARLCAAQTPNLLVLQRELVVVGDFLAERDRLLGVDDDFLLVLHGNDFGVTIGLKERVTSSGNLF